MEMFWVIGGHLNSTYFLCRYFVSAVATCMAKILVETFWIIGGHCLHSTHFGSAVVICVVRILVEIFCISGGHVRGTYFGGDILNHRWPLLAQYML